MSFFDTDLYKNVTPEDIKDLEEILNYETFAVIYKKELEKTKRILKRTYRDDYMIGIFSVLKLMLIFKSGNNKYNKIDIEPEEFVNVCYEALLAMTNNKRIFNRITNIANNILTLDQESAQKVIDELFNIEIVNMGFNIHDKIDVLEKIAEKNKVSSKEKQKIRVK